MTQTSTLTIAELHARVEAIFRKGGLNAVQAAALARVIVAGERDACKSHGIYRIEGALRTVKAGKVKPDAVPVLDRNEGSAIVKVDASGGFANPAFELGVPVLAERARKLGIAALVINDCTHFSALWPEIEAITAHGLAALALTPSHAWVAPAGGHTPVFGTNPIAFGWPRPGAYPHVFDFATSAIARGDLELHRRAGTPLPEGCGVDADGNPSTDPVAVAAGAMRTFGGHKGSALAMMVELMAGALIGDWTSRESLAFDAGSGGTPCHGELLLAFDPARLAGAEAEASAQRAEALFEAVTSQGARLPSQRRFTARERSLCEGVSVPAGVYREMLAMAAGNG